MLLLAKKKWPSKASCHNLPTWRKSNLGRLAHSYKLTVSRRNGVTWTLANQTELSCRQFVQNLSGAPTSSARATPTRMTQGTRHARKERVDGRTAR
jgi:hypothetical protein